MRAPTRILLLCSLLLAAVIGLRPAAANAADPVLTALANASPLSIGTDHHLTTAAIFNPNERIALWFDVPGGGAGPLSLDATGPVYAQGDGRLDVVINGDDWNSIAKSARSLVAFGLDSQVAASGSLNAPADLDLSLHIDGDHHATTAAIFTPNEQIVFWYNLPDGSAAGFDPFDGPVYANGAGALDLTIPADQWGRIPANATSLVAHGIYSTTPAVYAFPAR